MKNFKNIALLLSFITCSTPSAHANKRLLAFATLAVPASITAWYNKQAQIAHQKKPHAIKKFSPASREQTAGILSLMQQNQRMLLDPDEKALDALILYKKALIYNNQPKLKNLHIDIATPNPDSNEVLGYIAYQLPNNDYPAGIRTVAVNQETQRQGIGTALMQHAEKEARLAKNPQLLLVVYSNNAHMKDLTNKLGFSLFAKVDPASHVDDDGKPVHSLIYMKNL